MAENTSGATPRKTAKATRKTTQKPSQKATQKTTAKKAPTRKAAAKKAPAKKAPAASAGSGNGGGDGGRGAPTGARAALLAAQQLVDLTGREFEGIVGISKTDDGWTAQVEILEMRRIPDTTDVLAVYEVTVDQSGDLVGYRRTDRYTRGSAGDDRR